MEQLAANSHVPFIGVHEVQVGHGVIGGRLFSSRIVATRTAELALRILDGESPGDIAPVEIEPVRHAIRLAAAAPVGCPRVGPASGQRRGLSTAGSVGGISRLHRRRRCARAPSVRADRRIARPANVAAQNGARPSRRPSRAAGEPRAIEGAGRPAHCCAGSGAHPSRPRSPRRCVPGDCRPERRAEPSRRAIARSPHNPKCMARWRRCSIAPPGWQRVSGCCPTYSSPRSAPSGWPWRSLRIASARGREGPQRRFGSANWPPTSSRSAAECGSRSSGSARKPFAMRASTAGPGGRPSCWRARTATLP